MLRSVACFLIGMGLAAMYQDDRFPMHVFKVVLIGCGIAVPAIVLLGVR